MAAATVRLVLREEKTKANGEAPVYLRITENRKSRYRATGITLDPKHWNEAKEQVRKSHPVAPAINQRLQKIRQEAERVTLEGGGVAGALESVGSAGRGGLTLFFEAYIRKLKADNRFWEWKKYRVTLGKLQAALGEEITWTTLDTKALEAFGRHMRQIGNSTGTVRKEFGRLRRIVRMAVKQGLISFSRDPFTVFEMPKPNTTKRTKLSREQVGSLEALEGLTDALALARDAFVFAFYAGGMRFGDLCCLTPENVREGRIEYRMNKTGAPVSIPLPPAALALLERYRTGGPYLFPFLTRQHTDPVALRKEISSRNAVVNKHLATLARLAGIGEHVSFHIARHSFADYARSRGGNLYAVSKTLGHSSLTITQTYLKSFDREAVDNLANELWESE